VVSPVIASDVLQRQRKNRRRINLTARTTA